MAQWCRLRFNDSFRRVFPICRAMAPCADSFISSSYHTERIGPAAALATLKKMQAVDMIGHNTATGKYIARAESVILKVLTLIDMNVLNNSYDCMYL